MNVNDFEKLLEQVLTLLIQQHVSSNQAAEALMDSHQGRQKRIALINKLSGFKLKDVIASAGHINFLTEWEAIAYIFEEQSSP
ncbi:hypothetical protein [Paenibacillus sp. UNC451MF]|uniref:hypothetical protein n=1 Tax=Paenibacillus sp. UNC451MF TaxID=1449063 RepID=UPI000491A2B8|nr:hypothetical protein [Paenibacillus sp. UNC451MF]